MEEARDYFTDGDGWASRKLLLPLLNGGPGFFYAHFAEDRGDPMIFAVDPLVFEEVSLSKRTADVKRPETVAQFHRAADYATGRSSPQERLDLIDGKIEAAFAFVDLAEFGEQFKGRRVRIDLWQRAEGARPRMYVEWENRSVDLATLFTENQGVVSLGSLPFYPTGRATDDGWTEWSTGHSTTHSVSRSIRPTCSSARRWERGVVPPCHWTP